MQISKNRGQRAYADPKRGRPGEGQNQDTTKDFDDFVEVLGAHLPGCRREAPLLSCPTTVPPPNVEICSNSAALNCGDVSPSGLNLLLVDNKSN